MTAMQTATKSLVNATARLERAKVAVQLAEADVGRARAEVAEAVSSRSKYGAPDQLNATERQFCTNGKWIEAIKNLRNRANIGLKEAKDVVDEYRNRNPQGGM